MTTDSKFIVITTIHPPSEAIFKFQQWQGWQVVIVGDRKTPPDWYCEGTIYISIEDQYVKFGELAKAIPENTYTRKMLGYAYAISHGATAIFESDDDNIPYEDSSHSINVLLDGNNHKVRERLSSEISWVNIYKRFGASECWPRGFPLQYIQNPASNGQIGTDNKPWAVMQFLADEDPDVDAIYRMLNGKLTHFARDRGFILDEGTYCPFNSQATLWLPKSFPLLFLPLGVPDRVTDILRGYIALACLWKTGYSIAFSSPNVYQRRNIHNFFKDFQQELPLYENADRWAHLLLEISEESAVDCFYSALEKLISQSAIPSINFKVYKLFLKAANLI